ncbi:MAG: hypothetical protein KDD73_14045 [Anaerolineales bacterium]|nr:hypothetical protein [Anaerolineales bacterium]MCB9172256.1 hypothetical protein [Ardenticatenales bacterium]
MKRRTNRNFTDEVLRWVVTIIGVVLLVRLAFTLLNLVFNFSATPLGRLLNEGELFARMTDVSPHGVARQIVILVLIAIVVGVAQRTKREPGEDEHTSQE